MPVGELGTYDAQSLHDLVQEICPSRHPERVGAVRQPFFRLPRDGKQALVGGVEGVGDGFLGGDFPFRVGKDQVIELRERRPGGAVADPFGQGLEITLPHQEAGMAHGLED